MEIKGGSMQLAMIMATVKGIKPCMDDWIRADKFQRYCKICRRYGLFVAPDSVFNIIRDRQAVLGIPGAGKLTTTKAFGMPFVSSCKKGSVHVFISRSKRGLENALRDGWYPLIIKNRLINKPLIDAFKFGYSLGYPACCVSFFQKYNNWEKYSHLYEVFRNSPGKRHNHLCNPFTKDITYSYIYHIPCSFGCESTIALAARLRSAIYEEDPDFARKIDEHLKLPLLIFYERKFYAFEGRIRHGRLYYSGVHFIGQMPENNLYEPDLRRGDCLFIDGKDVVILRASKLVRKIVWRKKEFAPEVPYIIEFN